MEMIPYYLLIAVKNSSNKELQCQEWHDISEYLGNKDYCSPTWRDDVDRELHEFYQIPNVDEIVAGIRRDDSIPRVDTTECDVVEASVANAFLEFMKKQVHASGGISIP